MTGLLVGIGSTIVMFSDDIAKNALFCYGTNFAYRSLLAVSCFSLVGLSFDRYFFHVKHSNVGQSKSQTRKIMAIIWFSSFGFGLICLLLGFCIDQLLGTVNEIVGAWHLEHENIHSGTAVISLDLFGLCLVPSIAMINNYRKIIHKLWFSPCANLVQQRIKRKSTSMNISISCMYMVTWAPFYILKIVFLYFRGLAQEQLVQFVTLILTCLRCLILPVIYFSFSEQAKKELRANRSARVGQEPRSRRVTIDIDHDIGSKRGSTVPSVAEKDYF